MGDAIAGDHGVSWLSTDFNFVSEYLKYLDVRASEPTWYNSSEFAHLVRHFAISWGSVRPCAHDAQIDGLPQSRRHDLQLPSAPIPPSRLAA